MLCYCKEFPFKRGLFDEDDSFCTFCSPCQFKIVSPSFTALMFGNHGVVWCVGGDMNGYGSNFSWWSFAKLVFFFYRKKKPARKKDVVSIPWCCIVVYLTSQKCYTIFDEDVADREAIHALIFHWLAEWAKQIDEHFIYTWNDLLQTAQGIHLWINPARSQFFIFCFHFFSVLENGFTYLGLFFNHLLDG